MDWRYLSSSADFIQFQNLYSTFIPKYFKIKWVPSMQHNASGYYVYGNAGGNVDVGNRTIIFSNFDGFSTTRYDNTDVVLSANDAMQYNSFKTFDATKRWQTIVYPRRSQMVAPRQKFDDYNADADALPVTDTIRGMGRLYIQLKTSWEDSNNTLGGLPPVVTLNPDVNELNIRNLQLGQFYVNFYFYSFDRK